MIYSINSLSFTFKCGCGTTEDFNFSDLTVGVSIAESLTGDSKKNVLIVDLGSCVCGMQRFLKADPNSAFVSGIAINMIAREIAENGTIHSDYTSADFSNQMSDAVYLDDYESLPMNLSGIDGRIHLSAYLTKSTPSNLVEYLNRGALIYSADEDDSKNLLNSVAIDEDNRRFLYLRHGFSIT